MAWTVATKQDVLSLFTIDVDSLKDEWSTFAESFLLEYLGKDSVSDITTASNFNEYKSGTDGQVLLMQYPITVLNSITVDDVSQDINNYSTVGRELIANESTTLPDEWTYFPKGVRNIVVDYDSTVPDQKIYSFAVVMMIIAMILYEGRKGADADFEWGTVTQEFTGTTGNQRLGLVGNLNAILDELIGKKGKVKIR